jgi:hypothetical protein
MQWSKRNMDILHHYNISFFFKDISLKSYSILNILKEKQKDCICCLVNPSRAVTL